MVLSYAAQIAVFRFFSFEKRYFLLKRLCAFRKLAHFIPFVFSSVKITNQCGSYHIWVDEFHIRICAFQDSTITTIIMTCPHSSEVFRRRVMAPTELTAKLFVDWLFNRSRTIIKELLVESLDFYPSPECIPLHLNAKIYNFTLKLCILDCYEPGYLLRFKNLKIIDKINIDICSEEARAFQRQIEQELEALKVKNLKWRDVARRILRVVTV